MILSKRRVAAITAAILVLLCSQGASAQSCTVASSGINFGNYDTLDSTDAESAGVIRLACDASVSATIALSGGIEGRPADRAMTNGSSLLAYNLYTDPQRTVIWGDGTGGSDTVTLQGDGTDQPIYGSIPGRQRVTVGSYADTITLTVSY